jgi:hypothetical protein
MFILQKGINLQCPYKSENINIRNMKKLIIQITLAIVSLLLAYFIYNGIQGPIKFKNEVEKRSAVVVDKLKDIRDAQVAYRNVNGRFTTSFDTLVDFITTGKIPIIKLTADPEDTTFSVMFVDTVGFTLVMDSIFKNKPNFKPNELKYIPFSDGVEFDMKAGTTVKGNVTVNVIEVFAAHKHFLKGLELKKNHIDPEDGLKFGSMFDPTTDGNWE